MALVNETRLPFDYQVRFSRRSTVALHIRDGEVQVRAPFRTCPDYLHQFVLSKSGWIQEKLELAEQKAAERVQLRDGELVPFRGELYRICVEPSPRFSTRIIGQHLYITSTSAEAEVVKTIFAAWLKEQAKLHMLPCTEALAERADLQHKLRQVRFRKTRSKWGHCSSQGVIQFNWLIMMAPDPVIQYLIAHEVSHLRYLDHSPRFWQQVEQLCPDYKECRKWLRDNEHRFWL
ncbi:putative metal-dependent hydrolase [Oleiphilus messinensis]|uniref:Putative metal-dependent hydrolase n=1 Tax=Oleiphilus messinensis TaxID=141451 RepID=A0A1Y0IEC0_9GAMM|nr:SprT family zinc-dependent metalloprotease [Oleiphilus messinensis]ARU58136.1 putative metal-dependent hydrolase [Oleiphilus messinensis]